MPPVMLGVQHTTLGTGQVFKYRNLTPEALGDALPASARISGSTISSVRGTAARGDYFKVARYRGAYYMLGSDGVYKLQNNNSWSKETLDGGLPFTSPSDDSPYIDSVIKGGLFVATVNGKPRLFGWYKYDESVQAYHHRSFYLDPDTGQWVLGALANVGTYTGYYTCTYRGFDAGWGGNGDWSGIYYQFFDGRVLHILGNSQGNKNYGNNSEHKTYDPASDSWASITNPSGGNTDTLWGRTFCVWQGRLFAIHKGSTANVNYRASLWEFVGGTWSEVLQITVPQYDADSLQSRNALFTDGTNLYFFMRFRTSGDGWRAYQITPAMAVTDITTAVVPTGLRGTTTNLHGMLPIVDAISSPGQVTIYLRHWTERTYGVPLTLYKWNGPSAKLSLVDSGGNVANGLPHGVISGLHIYSEEPEVVIENTSDIAIGKTLSFKVYGGGTGKTIKFYFGTDVMTTQATLAGTATGGSATRNGNQVENVDADGTTVYTVNFDATAHGLSDGDSVQIHGTAA